MLASPKVQKGLVGVLVVLLAAIAAVLVIDRATSTTTGRRSADITEFDGSALPHVRAADFTLTNQNGKRVTLSHDRGHVVVLAWIHSLCKDNCPFMVEQIKGALNLLPAGGRGVDVIGISVEPGQDSVRHRRRFLADHEMTHRMQYVSGSLKVMRRVWRSYGVQPVTPKADHSAFVFLISKRGIEQIGFPSVQLTSGALAHDIRVLERQGA
jgi:protein SCO1